MALTVLEIYKHLPKKNCGECGVPTCLAFAMRIAGHQAKPEHCPYITAEDKAFLESESSPPMKAIELGSGEKKLVVGGEKVLFRHEKTFYNPTRIAALIYDSMSPEEISQRIREVHDCRFQRVGEILNLDMVALESKTGDKRKYVGVLKLVLEQTDMPLVLISRNSDLIEEALKASSERRPLIYGADERNWEGMSALASKYKSPLVVVGKDIEKLIGLVGKIKASHPDFDDILLDLECDSLKSLIEKHTMVRRLAFKSKIKQLGYPLVNYIQAEDEAAFLWAGAALMKYSSILVLKDIDRAGVFPLLTLRQNIFTDPQKPIQMNPGVYEINKPDENSPVIVTTNFTLTYFTVSGDIEASKVPCYLLVVDTEGMSVLTAWAAGKFDAEKITKFLKESGIEDKVKHRNLIIPGQVARLSGLIEEKSGWRVHVGPKDSSGLPAYLKAFKR